MQLRSATTDALEFGTALSLLPKPKYGQVRSYWKIELAAEPVRKCQPIYNKSFVELKPVNYLPFAQPCYSVLKDLRLWDRHGLERDVDQLASQGFVAIRHPMLE